MNWSNVKLILAREIRDQLRDRRTLFMIAVLPMLLYPLLGMSFFQIAQFMRGAADRGAGGRGRRPRLREDLPPLIENRPLRGGLVRRRRRRCDCWNWTSLPSEPPPGESARTTSGSAAGRSVLERRVRRGRLCSRPTSPSSWSIRRRSVAAERTAAGRRGAPHACQDPRPEIIYTTANEKSQIAFDRLSAVLERWTKRIGERESDGRRDLPLRRLGRSRWTRPMWPTRPSSRGRAHLVEDPARHAAALGPDRGVLSGRSTCVPARRNAARWKRCCAARPSGAKSCWASC